MDKSRDRISELRFFIPNAVPAHHRASRFHHLREPARKNAPENFQISLLRKTNQRERRERTSTHGIDITQGIGGGDLSEGVGIVDYGREEVDGLYESGVRRNLIHAGVVGTIEADQNIRVVLPG